MTDKITWHIVPQSLKTDFHAKSLERGILAECPSADLSEVRTFTLLMSCTTGLEFDAARARSALQEFKLFIEQDVVSMSSAALWERRLNMPLQIWTVWISAFNKGQELFDADPAELPTDVLTEDQKVEAATPGSPLT